MRGPHPFPERRVGDLPALREILSALEEQHARAAITGWSTLRAALAAAIGVARDDLARAEAVDRSTTPDGPIDPPAANRSWNWMSRRLRS